MEIIEKSKVAFTAPELYLLTMSPEVQKMKDAVTQRIEVDMWCKYTDTNSDGKEQTILAVSTPEHEVFATNSPTFIEDFFKMRELFAACGDEVHAVKVISGTSKAGREFITCTYAE